MPGEDWKIAQIAIFTLFEVPQKVLWNYKTFCSTTMKSENKNLR